MAFLLAVFLFSDAASRSAPAIIGSALAEMAAIFRDPETAWMVFLCLAVYFAAFLFFRYRGTPVFWRVANPDLWLACGLAIIAALYAIDYVPSTQALTLLGGAVLGQGMAFWASLEMQNVHHAERGKKCKIQNWFGGMVVSILVIILAWASVLHAGAVLTFQYRSQARWSGVWDNPNIFGMLMGTGFVLAFGIASGFLRSWTGKIVVVPLCLVAAGLMVRGLLHSYSRGAWLATVCGGTYLLRHWISREMRRIREDDGFLCGSCISRLKTICVPLSLILAASFVLMFRHCQESDWRPVRRAFSSVNTADFS